MSRSTKTLRDSRVFRPEATPLEDRVVLSYGAVPPSSVNLNASGNDKITISSFNRDGDYTATNSITRNEVDYRTFVASRTGTYTFEANANGSSIDTVAALFDSRGRRLAYNDDANGNTNNSKFSYRLTAGTTYVLGVSNYTGTRGGNYQVRIRSAAVTNSASQALGRTYASGSATLQGTNLHLELYGQTRSAFTYADHYIEVKILDSRGNAIHTGVYRRGFRTAGDFVPGSPASRNVSWDINVSNLDLSRAKFLSIVVGQS